MNPKTIRFVGGALRHARNAAAIFACTWLAGSAQAAVHGISGPTFNLSASAALISQPDGTRLYSWGYGCSTAPTGYLPVTVPTSANCPLMQLPGPTMIVKEGDTVTVNLTNQLPPGAGSTSILFPGQNVTATGGADGLLTKEAATGGGTVSYTFTAGAPGTYAYYSGTRPDLQVEMGLTGALVVLPSAASATLANCAPNVSKDPPQFSLAKSFLKGTVREPEKPADK